jgi:hypothetical protein
MFLFFSNRIGCLSSIAISIALTLLLLLFLGVFRRFFHVCIARGALNREQYEAG